MIRLLLLPLSLSILLLALPRPAQAALGDEASMSPELAPSGGSSSTGSDPLMKNRPKNAKTEITARKEATFDNAANLAIFDGSVVVKDPQFTLFCDHLKVTMNKTHKGLEQADATGHVVIVQENKDDSTGKVVKSTGRSGRAIYTPESGDIVLTSGTFTDMNSWPSVQHDVNLQTATEVTTVMTLNRNGKSKTVGGSKTTIIDSGGDQGGNAQ